MLKIETRNVIRLPSKIPPIEIGYEDLMKISSVFGDYFYALIKSKPGRVD